MEASGAPDRKVCLRVTTLSKTFVGTRALDGVSLTIDAGEVHALLGANGSGKSTLIKILSGYHDADAGSGVEVGGENLDLASPDASYKAGIRVVHQDLGLVPSRSVSDNLALNSGYPTRWGTIRAKEARRQAERDLSKLGLDLDPAALVETLSPALRTGVAVARALREDQKHEAHLLVLDEPSATMPLDEVEQLLAIVRSVAAQGLGVLYVTHRLDEVFEIANRVTVLRDGHLVTTMPASDLDPHSLTTLLVGADQPDAGTAAGTSPDPLGAPVMEIEGLRTDVIDGLDLTCRAGEILGIAGTTGSGREEVLGAIFGVVGRSGGRVVGAGAELPSLAPERSIRAGISYLAADRRRQGGFMDLTARENLMISDVGRHWRGLWMRKGAEAKEADEWFAQLGVSPSGGRERKLATFSGGNQQKVMFARGLRTSPKALLLDEPTQGVDVGAKVEIHREIREAAAAGMAVMVSSTDLDELAEVCTRVVVLRHGRLVSRLDGESLTAGAIARACLLNQGVMSHV